MPTTPSTQISIRLTYSSPYKGGTKTWSNRFYFNSTAAMTQAIFDDLADQLRDTLKACITSSSTVTGAIGYNPGSDIPAFSKTYTTAGTAVPSGSESIAPLEVVSLWRFTTTQRTVKNHPIYLFKYIHNQILGATGARETMVSGRRTTQQSEVDGLVAGLVHSGVTYKLAGPRGAVAQSGIVETYFTHRDFPA